jgi:hypothetical protein
MDINDLVRELDALISQLVRARGVLTGDDLNVIPPKRGRRRTRAVRVSDAASAKIAAGLSAKVAAGLKARWAKKQESNEDGSEWRSFFLAKEDLIQEKGLTRPQGQILPHSGLHLITGWL